MTPLSRVSNHQYHIFKDKKYANSLTNTRNIIISIKFNVWSASIHSTFVKTYKHPLASFYCNALVISTCSGFIPKLFFMIYFYPVLIIKLIRHGEFLAHHLTGLNQTVKNKNVVYNNVFCSSNNTTKIISRQTRPNFCLTFVAVTKTGESALEVKSVL